MDWIPSWLGRAHSRLWSVFRGEPFSTSEARRCLGRPPAGSNLVLSRLERAGWTGRLAHGWYVVIPPAAVECGMVHEWPTRLEHEDYFPVLALTVGALLGHLGSRLQGLTLFGSSSRFEQGPGSDIDLMVTADFKSGNRGDWLRELFPILDSADRVAYRQWKLSGAYHGVQLVPFRVEQLREPSPLLLDVSEDALILYDVDRTLRRTLGELRARLRKDGAVRRRDSQGQRYWLLPSPGRVMAGAAP